MTENKIQISQFFGDGGQVVIRTDDLDEALDLFEQAAKAADRLTDQAIAIKNIAKVTAGVRTSGVKSTGSKSSAPARKGATSSGGERCEHDLPWTDLKGERNKSGELYKNRFYCAYDTKDWKQRCKPWGENED